MYYGLDSITGLIAVYKTKGLIEQAYNAFRSFYPTVKLMFIDNSGGDECTEYLDSLLCGDPYLQLIKNEKNEGHGSALHQGIELIETDLVLTMDSDTKVVAKGGIECMLELMTPEVYGVGRVIPVDLGGRNVPEDWEGESMDFLLIALALLNKKQYHKYHKFTRFGLVNFRAFKEMYKEGKSKELVKNFTISPFIHHYPGSTRAVYGDCEDIVEGFTGRKGDMNSELE